MQESTITEGWREKLAEQVADREAMEKAFMDLSYSRVINNGRPLFRAPFLLGFEVVYKDSPEAKKMVGVYAFRVNAKLFYIPVCFHKGAVTCGDMIYSTETKLLQPLNEQSAEAIIFEAKTSTGHGVSRKHRSNSTEDTRLQVLAGPTKIAGAIEAFEEMALKAAQVLKEPNPPLLLPDMLAALGNEVSLRKMASMLSTNKPLEKWASYVYSPEDFQPVFEKIAAQVDTAPEPGVVLHKEASAQLSPELNQEIFKRGFALEQPSISKNVAVVDCSTPQLADVSTGGVYKFLGVEGECVALPVDLVEDSVEPYARDSGVRAHEYIVADKRGKYKRVDRYEDLCYLACCSEESPRESVESWLKTPGQLKSGESFILVNTSTLSVPGASLLHLRNVTKTPGHENRYVITTSAGCSFQWDGARELENPAPLYNGGNLGKNHLFLKVDHTDTESSPLNLGHKSDIYEFLMGPEKAENLELTKISCRYDAMADTFKGTVDDFHTFELPVKEFAIKLASQMPVEDVYFLLDNAEAEEGGKTFAIFGGDWDKKAFFTQLMGQESPTESYDATTGTMVVHPEEEILRTSTPQGLAPETRVGDRLIHENSNPEGFEENYLMSAPPEQIIQAAKSRNLSQVLDHGMIGSLTQTFNAVDLIKDYIPALEQGTDRFGRILFLIYFRPSDFEMSYGSDRVEELENMMRNAFESSGKIVLEMKKKTNINR